jgi:hypothetical protein
MNFSHLRGQLEALRRSLPKRAQLPPGFVDPISAMLRAKVASGETRTTETTPAAVEAAKVSMGAWFARARAEMQP